MNPSPTLRLPARCALALAAFLSIVSPAAAQSPAERLHQAYYLQHERQDLEGALALYDGVANDRRASDELRAEARRRASEITEELASSDFAQLSPADTIFYVEFNRPGAQLRALLDQLGLLGAGGERLGISPLLVEGLLGMRGVAVAITGIDMRDGPSDGVAILHPGDLDVVRGLLETALPAGGQPVEPIAGHATWSIEGQAFVTLTSRLVVAGRHREDVAGVLARMQNGGEGSLARSAELAGAMAMRGSDLMFFCLNLQPVMPMIRDMIERETRRDPEVRAALAFLDLESTRTIAGRAGVDEHGVSFDFAVELDEAHRNLAFHLMRMPDIDAGALALVPSGPAMFCVGAVNRDGDVPPGETDAAGRPVVTMMDFGREVFANVTDVAVFVMPQVERAPWGPMPDVGLAMRVNDPARSVAMWQFLLGTAQAATGGPAPGAPGRRGDVVLHRFQIEGVPVHLAQAGSHLVLSPSDRLIGAAVEAAKNGRSVATDPAYAETVALAGGGSTVVAAMNLGRCGEIGKHFMSDRERREAEPYLELMKDTTLSLAFVHTANRCGARGRITGIPDVGPMLTAQLQREMHGGARPRVVRATSANGPTTTATAPATSSATTSAPSRERFEREHASGRHEAARQLALQHGASLADDPFEANNFAWALLTEERYEGRYDEVALRLSKASNEATGWANWYYLDTYARALFKSGAVDDAIEIQQKAIEVGADDPRIGEARSALEEYRRAKRRAGIR